MQISKAVADRISYYLNEMGISHYRLEQMSAIPHNTMLSIMGAKNKGLNIRTLFTIINCLGITPSEFFDAPVFSSEELVLD